MTRVPASHGRRIARRSSSTSPPHIPCEPTPNACRSESSGQSGRTGQRAQTAMACAAWSRALAVPGSGNQSSGSTREPAHRASRYTRSASSPSVRSCGSRRTRRGLETISTRLARTRRRLRQLGVRRRHWASEQRPAAGWASLTDIERATARLVAEGLTNQRIADQLFISTHTAAFHLRQVFRKLDIGSRVDLARIALEHARPEAAQTP